MGNPVQIKNHLLVIGNRVAVPGFEPLSEQTTNNLSLALQGAVSYIDLDLALALVPGSKVFIPYAAGPTSGSFGHDKWFIIPEGPPPDGNECPKNKILDTYKILQDAARAALESGSTESPCLSEEINDFVNVGQSDCVNDFAAGLE